MPGIRQILKARFPPIGTTCSASRIFRNCQTWIWEQTWKLHQEEGMGIFLSMQQRSDSAFFYYPWSETSTAAVALHAGLWPSLHKFYGICLQHETARSQIDWCKRFYRPHTTADWLSHYSYHQSLEGMNDLHTPLLKLLQFVDISNGLCLWESSKWRIIPAGDTEAFSLGLELQRQLSKLDTFLP